MKKIIYSCFTALVLLLPSCSDMLDLTPTDKYPGPLVWQDQNLIQMYVNEQYSGIANNGNFFHVMFFADEIFDKHNQFGSSIIRENNLTSDNVGGISDVLRTWDVAYKYIQNFNVYFKNIETSPVEEDFKKETTAEIKFIRAYVYAKLIWAYGGVPIIEEVYDKDSDWSQVKRKSWDECVTYILKDLDDVIAALPDRPADRSRASANAARALKARVLLYDASPLNNPTNDIQKWKAAADAAATLFDKGYSLANDYGKMFLDVNNTEYIFAKEFSATYAHKLTFNLGPAGEGGRNWATPTQNLVDAYETIDGQIPVTSTVLGTVNSLSMYDPAKPYENRDPRFYATIYYNGAPFLKRKIETFDGGYDMLNQDATLTSYIVKKFVEEDLGISETIEYTTPFPHFRLAEMYLNYAEAQFHIGGADGERLAREYVNKVRSRAGVSMPDITEAGDALLKRIYHERRIELALEGHRYHDVRRWKIASETEIVPLMGFQITKNADGSLAYKRSKLTIVSRETSWKDAFYRLPISFTEIQKSKDSLVQNSGY